MRRGQDARYLCTNQPRQNRIEPGVPTLTALPGKLRQPSAIATGHEFGGYERSIQIVGHL